MHKKIMQGENDARSMLLALGMGHYNATIAIQYMFLSPAATDPAMPSIMLIVKHLQAGLRAAGAKVPLTGVIDNSTARALITLVGPDWNEVTWFALYQAVIQARRLRSLERPKHLSMGAIPGLPALPGGDLTYVLAAVAAFYLYTRKKR